MKPKKIIGGTVGMGLPKPDLMQTDPKAGDFVKGKEEFLKQATPESGVKPEDGFSPIATVTQTATGARITITDKNGTTEATITNGKDGNPGKDGKTPVKGVDYFTPEDTQEIAEQAAALVPGGGGGGGHDWVTILNVSNAEIAEPSNIITYDLTGKYAEYFYFVQMGQNSVDLGGSDKKQTIAFSLSGIDINPYDYWNASGGAQWWHGIVYAGIPYSSIAQGYNNVNNIAAVKASKSRGGHNNTRKFTINCGVGFQGTISVVVKGRYPID